MRAAEKHAVIFPWKFTTVGCYHTVHCQSDVILRKNIMIQDTLVCSEIPQFPEKICMSWSSQWQIYDTAGTCHRAVLQIAAEEAMDYITTALDNHRCLFLEQLWRH